MTGAPPDPPGGPADPLGISRLLEQIAEMAVDITVEIEDSPRDDPDTERWEVEDLTWPGRRVGRAIVESLSAPPEESDEAPWSDIPEIRLGPAATAVEVSGELPTDAVGISEIPDLASRPRYELERRTLVYAMLLVVGVVVVGIGVLIGLGDLTAADASELLGIALTPLFTLLGAAVAFYFRNPGGL